MGLLGDILQGVVGIGGVGYQVFKDQHLTGAEQEANAFNAEQAELSRRFESQQAEIARDWQEQQYLKYNSPEALVRQYQSAGLNPAMMFGGSTPPAASSTSIPSSASASSVAPQGAGNMVQMLTSLADAIAGVQLKRSQVKNVDADTANKSQEYDWNPVIWENEVKTGEVNRENMLAGIRKMNADIDLIYAEKGYKDISSEKVKHEIYNLVKEGSNIDARTASEYIHQAVMAAQELLVKSQAASVNLDNFEKQWRNNMIERTGISPDSGQWQLITQGLQNGFIKVKDWLSDPVNTVKSWFSKK